MPLRNARKARFNIGTNIQMLSLVRVRIGIPPSSGDIMPITENREIMNRGAAIRIPV